MASVVALAVDTAQAWTYFFACKVFFFCSLFFSREDLLHRICRPESCVLREWHAPMLACEARLAQLLRLFDQGAHGRGLHAQAVGKAQYLDDQAIVWIADGENAVADLDLEPVLIELG
jgi:hypothetical protein